MSGGKAKRVVFRDGKPVRVPAHQYVPTDNVQRGDMAEWKANLERRRQWSEMGLFRRLLTRAVGR